MSDARFADGLRYRIEIPSVEGPRVLEAVLDEAERRSVPVRRVSQGSGVMMLTDAEICDMARLGADAGVEVSLFLGPRGAWDTGGQSLATAAAGGIARGDRGIESCVAEVRRGVALGIRSFLIADLGVLRTLELDQVLLFRFERGLVQHVLALPSDPDAFEAFWA